MFTHRRIDSRRRRFRRDHRRSRFRRLLFETLDIRRVLATVTWDGGAGTFNWTDAANWSGNVLPGPADDVVIPDLSGTPTITYSASAGTVMVNSLQSSEALSFTGGTFTATAGANLAASVTLQGGTLLNTTITTSGGAKLVGSTAGGTLNGITLNGDLDLLVQGIGGTGAFVTVLNGLVLNGTATLGANLTHLDFSGTQTLSGTGTVVFSNATAGSGTAVRLTSGGTTLTIGPGITLRGGHSSGPAQVGLATGFLISNPPSNVSVINHGKIAADVNGTSIKVRGESFTNTGTLEAKNGGHLDLLATTIAQNGTATVGTATPSSSGILSLSNTWNNAGTITLIAGTVNFGGTFTPSNVGNLTRQNGTAGAVNLTGTLNNVGTTLTLDTANNGYGTWQMGAGSLINGGTITTTNGAVLTTFGTATLGSVTISAGSELRIAGDTIDIGGGLTVNGKVSLNPRFDGHGNVTGVGHLRFFGTQTIGGTGEVLFGGSTPVMTLQQSGMTLTIGAGLLVHGGVGFIQTNGSATLINNGTIRADAASGIESLAVRGRVGNMNFINGPTGTLEVTHAAAKLRLETGWSPANAGTIQNQNSSPITVSTGTLEIITGDWSNPGPINLSGGTFTISAAAWQNATPIHMTGGTLNIGGTVHTSNLANLTRQNGTAGAVNLTGTLNNVGTTLTLDTANNGMGTLQMDRGGRIDGGTVTTRNGAMLASSAGSSISLNNPLLNGVTLSDGSELRMTGATIDIHNGLIVHGKVTVNGRFDVFGNPVGTGHLRFDGTQTLGGTGEVAFGSGVPTVSLKQSGMTLTIGTGVLIHGGVGAIYGSGTLVNNGTIRADASSGIDALTVYSVGGSPINFINGVTGSLEITHPSAKLRLNTGVFNGPLGTVENQNTTTPITVPTGTFEITTGNWTNPGPIHVSGGTFTVNAGAWQNATPIQMTGGTFNIGGTVTVPNLANFTRQSGTAGTVNLVGTLNNTGTTLTLDTANNGMGTWLLGKSFINGGTITTANGAVLRTAGIGLGSTGTPDAVLSDVTISPGSELQIFGEAVDVYNGLTVHGKLALNPRFDVFGNALGSGNVRFRGTQTIGGSGEIVFGGLSPRLSLDQSNMTLTIGAGLLIRGGGDSRLGNSTGSVTGTTVVNHGTIRAEGSGTLVVAPNNLTNNGTLRAQGATLNVTAVTPTNYVSGALTGGIWQATSGGILRVSLPSGVITNSATILLDGIASRFYRDTGTTAAITNLTANTAQGSLTLLNGHMLVSGANLSNHGTLVTDATSRFHARTPGLVSLWSAEGNANDSVNGNNGTLRNAAALAPGQFGSAFSLSSNDNVVEIPDNTNLVPSSSGLTIATWVKPTVAGVIFSDHNGCVNWETLELATSYFIVNSADGSSSRQIVSFPELPLGVWSHLAAMWDDVANQSRVYVNGVQVASGAAANAPRTRTAPWVIGGRKTTVNCFVPSEGSYYAEMTGLVDELGFFNRALSVSEVQVLMDGGLYAFTQSAGRTTINGSLTADPVAINGGTLAGTGIVAGPVTAAGTGVIAPGNSAGILHVNDFDLQPGGTLFIETGGSVAGSDYDQLNVTGTVTLAGKLEAYVISTIVKGTPFTIINNDGDDPVVGTFHKLPEGATFDNGYDKYRISYVGGDGNDVVLTALTDVRVVTNTSDGGTGSLRGEMTTANGLADPAAVIFRIPGSGPHSITPASPLPTINGNMLFVDASTQPGYSGAPLVEVNGAAAGSSDGFRLEAGGEGSLIRGFAINRFSRAGVAVVSADRITVAGNFIGTDATGLVGLGNGGDGILLYDSANSVIGGPNPFDRNVISGNGDDGIDLRVRTTGTLVEGNYIGVSADGANDLGNAAHGVHISSPEGAARAAFRNFIGVVGGARNVISGNDQAGVAIHDAGTTRNEVVNNDIGLTAPAGVVPNGRAGVWVFGGADGNVIGLAGAGNALAGTASPDAAVVIENSTGNTIQGNRIGTNADGSIMFGSYQGINLRSPGNLVGGRSFGDGNRIRGMSAGGIDAVPGNTFLGNSIFDSDDGSLPGDFLGIDVDPAGVTLTDVPEIDLAVAGVSRTRVGGSLSGVPGAWYRIEIFASSLPGVTGHGEGETYLGFVDVRTDAAGFARFNFASSTLVAVGDFISATATREGFGTSEFAFSVAARDSIRVRNTNDAGPDSLRQAMLDANAAAGGDVIEFDLPAPGSIVLASTLPQLTGRTILDGSSQPGYAGAPLVEVDGNNVPVGLLFEAGSAGSEIRGLALVGFGGSGIEIDTDDVTVAGNYVGIRRDGVTSRGNAFHGISIVGGSRHLIGGSRVADRNLLSGNIGSGVRVAQAGSGIRIQGNYIGTDATGTLAVGNAAEPSSSEAGVLVTAMGGNSVLIGTDGDGVDDAGEGNLISGNFRFGIRLQGGNTDAGGHVVAGNLIGVSVSGSDALPNQGGGIVILTSRDNRIGTNGDGVSDDLERNVISGNRNLGGNPAGSEAAGIEILDSITGDALLASGNVVAGNFIGTDASGLLALGNELVGLAISDAPGTLIGGALLAQRNVIAANGVAGVSLGSGSDGTRMFNNYVGLNAAGTSLLSNVFAAVGAFGDNMFIGTDGDGVNDAAEGNVIAGNGEMDVLLAGDVVVAGNKIGTNAAGTVRLSSGIAVQGGGAAMRVGTNADGVSDAAERNLIVGPVLIDVASPNGRWAGNFFGYAADGATVLDTSPFTVTTFLALIGGAAPIQRNYFAGPVHFDGAADVVFQGNYVGVKPDGVTPAGAGLLRLDGGASFNQIGGATPGAGNVISRVVVAGSGTALNLFEGNRIGTNAAGTDGLGIDGPVFVIEDGASSNQLGTAAAGNVISSAARLVGPLPNQTAVLIRGVGTDDNTVRNNLIGLSAAGTGVIGNARGVQVEGGARGTVIGGPGASDGNVIAGNGFGSTSYGVWLVGAENTTVEGNRIGTDRSGRVGFGQTAGVVVQNGGSGNVIRGNLISGHAGDGIRIGDGTLAGASSGVTVVANLIGTDAAGNSAIPNAVGVRVRRSADVVMGGVAASARNVISGNVGPGVIVEHADTLVLGNYIGVNAAGFAPLSNTDGVHLLHAANPAVRQNVISGNSGRGLFVSGGSDAWISGNIIGLDATGTAPVGASQLDGIVLSGADGATIGGSSAAERNVISGNSRDGIVLTDGTHNGWVAGNFIGTDVTGTVERGNGRHGIAVTGGARDNTIGDYVDPGNVIAGNRGSGLFLSGTAARTDIVGNWIGANRAGLALPNLGDGVTLHDVAGVYLGDPAWPANVIAHNQGRGVAATGANQVVSVRGNSLHNNAALGIDLGGAGPTANDPSDLDGLQNFPQLDAAIAGSQTFVAGNLTSTPHGTFWIDFYASDAPDASGFGQGQRYLGALQVTTDGTGGVVFATTLSAATVGGEFITATATNASGNTSEFSLAIQANSNAPPTIVQDSLIVTVIHEDDESATFGIPTLVVNEGDRLYLTGDFADADETAQVSISWGDGTTSSAQVLRIESFTSSHVYADDDPSRSPSNLYPVVVRVTDADGSGSAVIGITVRNVDPVLHEGSGLLAATVNEGGAVTLAGSFTDPGTGDYHFLKVHWGDGTGHQTFALPRGERSFAVTHVYADDGAYDVRYSLFDDDRDPALPQPGDAAFAYAETRRVTVLNLAPTAVIHAPAHAVEGEVVAVSATVTDPGVADTFSYEWLVTRDGRGFFSSTQPRLSFTPMKSGAYRISLTVSDDEFAYFTTSVDLAVANGPPVIRASDLKLTANGSVVSTVVEGTEVVLSGTFADGGSSDLHTVTIDFGDGTPPVVVPVEFGQRRFSGVRHTYADDRPGANDQYLIHVTVSDGTDSSSAVLPIVVLNAAPTVSLRTDRLTDATVRLAAAIHDAGVLDTHTVEWFVNGVQVEGSGLLSIPRPSGPVQITFRAIDDDGGVGAVTATLLVTDDSDNTVHITQAGGQIIVNVDGQPYTFTPADHVLLATSGGADVVTVDAAATTPFQIDGGPGNDFIQTASANDTLIGGPGADTLRSGAGDDVLISDEGDDRLEGGTGNDEYRFIRFSHKTVIDVEGIDTLNFTQVEQGRGTFDGVSIDLRIADGTAQAVHSSGTLALSGTFENVLGSAFHDVIIGNSARNLLFGGPGDDSISGAGGGDDTIGGSGGLDTIFGGPGDDTIASGGGGSIDGGEGDDSILAGGQDTIFGGPGDDSIRAGGGDDTLAGTGGRDTIFGGPGDDTIASGGGGLIDGGDGHDSILGGGGDTIFGGPGDDYITIAGGDDDTISGSGSRDTIFGGPGDDTIEGGGGSDIRGGDGDDSILGGGGRDTIFGGPGDDTIQGAGGAIDGGDGHDSILGGGGDTIFGGPGDDTIQGGGGGAIDAGEGDDSILASGGDTIFGGPGDDTIQGGGGILDGGTGDDSITGGGGHDTIFGGPGDDTIESGGGSSISGGSGDDSILGGGARDTIFGGPGDDTIESGGGSSISGGDGQDSILGGGGDTIFGGPGDDTIGSGGGSSIDGGEGRDSILGGLGDTIFGGPGDDTIESGGGSSIDGGAGRDSILGGGDDTIFGGPGDDTIESGGGSSISGGAGRDSILGGGGDTIFGGPGDDTIESGGGSSISGGAGRDSILGGLGDTIFGGPGDDTIESGGGSSINGGDGDDSILANSDDTIFGGPGDDTIQGGDGGSSIDGGDGDDSIIGGSSNDTIFGGPGDDTIQGGGGTSLIDGGAGDDSIVGGAGGGESLHGGDGDDTIASGGGVNDTIFGAAGDDVVLIDSLALKIFGGTDSTTNPLADDRVLIEADADIRLTTGPLPHQATLSVGGVVAAELSDIRLAVLRGGPGDNRLDATAFLGDAVLIGGGGNDTLLGGPGNDSLVGGTGDDLLVGGGGNDTYFFEGTFDLGRDTIDEASDADSDTLDFFGLAARVDVDLARVGLQTPAPGLVELVLVNANSVENVIGTIFSDRLWGNDRDNRLMGGGGLDFVYGAAGNDYLSAFRTRYVFLDFDSETGGTDHVYTQAERNGIQARIEHDFAAFDVVVSQLPPENQIYAAVRFNNPPRIGGREVSGGAASWIGFRDVARGGTVQVDVNGFLGLGANKLPPNEQNFIALSSTIAAHELAHLFGLRHHDAFGSPGTGIFSKLPPDRFLPRYNGPAAAFETADHLIASPASVGTTLTDALHDPYFGEREALKLAFGETGESIFEVAREQKTATVTIAGTVHPVQPLGALPPLAVPNTLVSPRAANYGVPLDAAAANVLGRIERAGAVSESDFYSFAGNAGDVVTFELMSFSLRDRYANTIDSVLRVYDVHGQKLSYFGHSLGAFNDDGFEPTDSILLDLVLPATGTYYVEVDTFHFFSPEFALYLPAFDAAGFCARNPRHNGCTDTDTGNYELLIYRFAHGISAALGDTVVGGPGVDTLVASSGNDTFLTDGLDVFAGPAGSIKVVENRPPTLAPIPEQQVDEESLLQFFVTGAVDEDFADVLRYHLLPAGGGSLFPVGAVLDPITGEFAWTPSDDGFFQVLVVVSDLHGLTAAQPLSITVHNIDVSAAITAISGDLLEGSEITITAEAVDATGAATSFTLWYEVLLGTQVVASHEGEQPTSLTFTPPDNGSYHIRVTATGNTGVAGVGEAVLSIANVAPSFEAGANEILPPAAAGAFSREIVFHDPGADTWIGTVDFGDGSPLVPLVIDGANRRFTLNHVFSQPGTFNTTITLQDDDGASHTDTFDVTVERDDRDTSGPELLDLVDVAPNPRNLPVAAIDAVFSEELDLETLDDGDLTLRRDGLSLPLSGLLFERLSEENRYRISGLGPFTQLDGLYELLFDPTGVADRAGNPGVGSVVSEVWLMDATPPVPPTQLAIAPDTGRLANDAVTKHESLTLSGMLGESGLTLRVSNLTRGVELGFTTVAGSNFQHAIVLEEGAHRLRVVAEDDAGNSAEAFLDVIVDRTAPRVVAIEAPSSPRTTPVETLDVTFETALDPTTFDWRALSLRRNGGAELITSAVTVSQLTELTYRISGLAGLTVLPGSYELRLKTCELADLAGNAGVGAAVAFWEHVGLWSTATALEVSPHTSRYGQELTLTARVTHAADDDSQPSGSVEFFAGALSLGTSTVGAGGFATVRTAALVAGSHQLTAVYSGGTTFGGSQSAATSHEVLNALTATTLTQSVSTTQAGEAVLLTASVQVLAPGAGSPTGTMTFKDGNTVLGSQPLDALGTAQLSVSSLAVGPHTITAEYSGAVNFAGSISSGLTHTVNTPGVRDVTAQVSLSLGGFRYNRTTRSWLQTVSVTNTSGQPLAGPVSLVLDNLSSNARLIGPTGYTSQQAPLGSPYRDLLSAVFAINQTITLTLEFDNPTNAAINYTARVLAGPGTR